MNKLNELFQELGISKVRLSKYLGVSRQMVYNYLELDDINKWPKEKKLMLFKLLDISDGADVDNIDITTDYLMAVETRLNQGVRSTYENDSNFDLKGLSKNNQTLISDIVFLLKEKLNNDKNDENATAILYLYHLLQSMDNVAVSKYILGFMSKTTGFIKPDEFKFNADKQFVLEAIMYQALTLYNNRGASKSRLSESHRRFVQEIEQKNEEKLSRTQQLNVIRVQALKELNYTEINTDNATEVFEKIAEIESRNS